MTLKPSLDAEVGCVVHGGDIFFSQQVPASRFEMAFEPLKQVADIGGTLDLVPGIYECSAIPHGHRVTHPLIHPAKDSCPRGMMGIPEAYRQYFQ